MAHGTPKAQTPAGSASQGQPAAQAPQDQHPQAPRTAPGAPGRPAHWATGAKSGVGTALGTASSVWFTISHGILTEVFYPSVDTASTRDLQLLVVDGRDFFSEEKRDTKSEVSYLAPGVPAYRLINTCRQGRYRVEKDVLADPRRSVVLQQVHFTPLRGGLDDYSVCALLSPHLGNQGAGNTASVGEYKGIPMLFAHRGGLALALACTAPWKKRSAGFVGTSDGWQDLSRHRRLTWAYDVAENGTVALVGQIDLGACDGRFILALAFGRDEVEAGHRARASLLQGFADARQEYVRAWSEWQKDLLPLAGSRQQPHDVYRLSGMVMRAHEAKDFPGAIVASLAVPWGDARGDHNLGYHLVWARDMINTVGGLLAVRQHADARRVLFYLYTTQEADGHWPQNMYLDGRPCWGGVQLDETAFVILMVGMARHERALNDADLKFLWPMVRQAAAFLVRHGPVTPMDRWEEVPGYYASTIAVEIPALLVAADVADAQGETALAGYLRETADAWNDAIERLLYVRGTDLARQAGVDGYYVRFARPDQMAAPAPAYGAVTLPNHPPGAGEHPAANVVSPDALTLVRFGLRAADDPRIVNTVRVIDQHCKVETPRGPCWHRYTDDGYGVHADGSPFDGTGIGRAWPLLTGERAHYELAAGRPDEAERLLRAMEALAGDSGLLPEQFWDTEDLPEKELFFGRPSGSAMPLVWAHAEYVKLRRSLHDGRVFDLPPEAVQRYLVEKTGSRHAAWRFEQRLRVMPAGRTLRLEAMAPAVVRWSSDGWKTSQEVQTRDTGIGVHVADLPTENLPAGADVVFTFYWPQAGRWEGPDFHVAVEAGAAPARPASGHAEKAARTDDRRRRHARPGKGGGGA
jgi:glucoamylase